jgi:hypothetical protein
MKRAPLPPTWYATFAETAHELGTHPDRIAYYADCGLIVPAALVLKSAIPFDCPGPAPHVVVPLPEYRAMEWQPGVGGDRVAPLVGEFRAFQVDGEMPHNLTLRDCDQVLVSRADLVVTLDQRESLEAMGAMAKPINKTERNTLLCIIGLLLREAYPDTIGKPYAMAETISRELALDGVTLGRQAIANKVIAAQDLLLGTQRVAA